jgi:hypothetical protein
VGDSAETSLRRPVTFDPATRRLTVGSRSTVVPDVADNNEAMLRGYLALVARARGFAVASLTQVRQHDVAVLAELLDLEDADLEARFVRLLGMTPEVAADTRRRLVRQRSILAAAGITVGVLLSAGGTAAASGPTGPTGPTAPAASVAPVAVSIAADAVAETPPTPVTDPPVTAPPATAPPAQPAQETAGPPDSTPPTSTPPTPASSDPEVQIGDALVIERGTPPDDPSVGIGDAESFGR